MDSLNGPNLKENIWVDRILKYIVDIIVAIMLAVFFITVIASSSTVKGSSMSPTLSADSTILINRAAYKLSSPKRYDVIVFFAGDDDTPYVKRILGLPGDTVQISDGKLYINGEEETYNEDNDDDIVYEGDFSSEVTLGDDEYFVIGDNWNNSTDSRSSEVGLISSEDIYGKVWFVISPFSEIGFVD